MADFEVRLNPLDEIGGLEIVAVRGGIEERVGSLLPLDGWPGELYFRNDAEDLHVWLDFGKGYVNEPVLYGRGAAWEAIERIGFGYGNVEAEIVKPKQQ